MDVLTQEALAFLSQNGLKVVGRPSVKQLLVGDDQLFAVFWSLQPSLAEVLSLLNMMRLQRWLLNSAIAVCECGNVLKLN